MTLEEAVEELLIKVGGRPWNKSFGYTYHTLLNVLKRGDQLKRGSFYDLSQGSQQNVEKGIRDFKAQCVQHNKESWQRYFGDDVPSNKQFIWTMCRLVRDEVAASPKPKALKWKRKV